MLMGVLVFFHVIACLTLILVILLQVGRGHGLSGASFASSGVQTVFGTKTADFLSKATSVMAIMFMITCISLDIIHSRRSKSLFASKGAASQVDVAKIREALEKIKAEQAQKTGSLPPVTQTAAGVDASMPTQNSAPAAEPVPSPQPVPAEAAKAAPQAASGDTAPPAQEQTPSKVG